MITLRKLWAALIGKVEEHHQRERFSTRERFSADEYAHQLAIHLGRSKQALRMASGQLPDPDLPNPFVAGTNVAVDPVKLRYKIVKKVRTVQGEDSHIPILVAPIKQEYVVRTLQYHKDGEWHDVPEVTIIGGKQ